MEYRGDNYLFVKIFSEKGENTANIAFKIRNIISIKYGQQTKTHNQQNHYLKHIRFHIKLVIL